MTEFVDFPSTPYLWRPTGFDVRDDKVLTDEERRLFLAQPLHVEEKLDGENLGISFDGDRLLLQARGSYVEPGGRRFRGVASWLAPRRRRIEQALGTELVLFGEWCAVEHTVRYDALPDWLVVFDVYDRSAEQFWHTTLRDELAHDLGLPVPPFLGAGRFDEAGLLGLIGTSRFGHELMEGLVARARDGGDIRQAKVVRPDFVQQIDEHWMSTIRPANRLALQ